MFRLPPITFIGGENPELPLREIVNRLEVSNLFKLNPINSEFHTNLALSLLNTIECSKYYNMLQI